MTDRGIFRAKGQVWGSWILWNCPTESLVFTAFRAKGQFINKYFRSFLKSMRYRVFIYKKENGEKNLPFCPFWIW